MMRSGWDGFQSGLEFAPPGSLLDVELKEACLTNENNEIIGKPSYRIAKIYEVHLPNQKNNDGFPLPKMMTSRFSCYVWNFYLISSGYL